MELRFKDFHRKLTPFKDESMEQLLEEQVNQWIKLNKPKRFAAILLHLTHLTDY